MAAPLDTLVTNRPNTSAVFRVKDDELPETVGQHLFIHHALHAICQDADLESPDEQIRGMAMGIWDGLPDRNKIFWTERAATAALVRDREDFLLTDGSTDLAKDHEVRARAAVTEYKRSLMSDNVSIADTASIADTEPTEEEIEELDAELPVHVAADESAAEPGEESPFTPTVEGRTSSTTPAPDALQGQSEDINQSNITDPDRELRDLQKLDTADGTPALSIASLPPVEAERPDNDPADVLEKGGDTGGDPEVTDDGVADPSRPESAATVGTDIGSGSLDHPSETANDSGFNSKITSAASSLDWAEESQEQADREAATRVRSPVHGPTNKAPAARPASPEPDHMASEEVPSRALWVGSLQKKVTKDALKKKFAKFGRIEFVKMGSSKAYGFVNFADVESAIAAKRAMDGQKALSAHDPLLIRFAEDRSPKGPVALSKGRDVSSASKHDAPSKLATPGSDDSRADSEYPLVAGGKSVKSTTKQETADCSDGRSVGTATSAETRSTTNPYGFSPAQLDEARRFSSQVTKGGKPPKGKPVTLSVAVQKQPKKASNGGTLQKGRIGSGASTPTPRTPQEDRKPPAKALPLAKWQLPVDIRDFAVPPSTEPEPDDEGGKGRDFFLFHALPVVCDDLDVDEPDRFAISIAKSLWLELPPQLKKMWIEDSRSLRGYSMRKPGLISTQKRFQDSRFTKDYRRQIIKALAVRNEGELKFLQPELVKLVETEKRIKRQQREQAKRQAKHAEDKKAEAEQKRIDLATTARQETEAGEHKRGHNLAMPNPPASKEVPKDDRSTYSATAETPVTLSPSISDPPPPYESDSAAAGPPSEITDSDWQVVDSKSKPSAKDTAKRGMNMLPWNKVARV